MRTRSCTSRISEIEKSTVTIACQRLIDEVLKPRFLSAINARTCQVERGRGGKGQARPEAI